MKPALSLLGKLVRGAVGVTVVSGFGLLAKEGGNMQKAVADVQALGAALGVAGTLHAVVSHLLVTAKAKYAALKADLAKLEALLAQAK